MCMKEENPDWILGLKVNKLIEKIEQTIENSNSLNGIRILITTDEGWCTDGVVTLGNAVTPNGYSCFSYNNDDFCEPLPYNENDETFHVPFKNVLPDIKTDTCRIICNMIEKGHWKDNPKEDKKIHLYASEIIALITHFEAKGNNEKFKPDNKIEKKKEETYH